MKYNRPYVDGLFYLKLQGILIFRNYQFLVALLHFQAVSYDLVYMQREQFRKVFHLTNLKEGCFSSCHVSGTNRKKFWITIKNRVLHHQSGSFLFVSRPWKIKSIFRFTTEFKTRHFYYSIYWNKSCYEDVSRLFTVVIYNTDKSLQRVFSIQFSVSFA